MSTQTKPKSRVSKKKAESEVVVEVVAPVPAPVPVSTPAPVPEPTPVVVSEPVVELSPAVNDEAEPEVESAEVTSTAEEEVKADEPVDPVERLQNQFDSLRKLVTDELALLSESDKAFKKNKVLTLLRKVNRQVNLLEKQTFRLVKNKKSVRKNKVVSGFQKPTRISKDLTKFTGWNENDLHSRVEVTKFICDYIKTNNLQNPEDRRQIVPDAKLQKLLGYNPKKETEPLRYYSIQFHLNKMKHFPKDPVVVVAA
jgi:SWIB-domain-containing proteins implicated in chromatin remodeling